MQVPFPELAALTLYLLQPPSETVPVVPDSLLGGSAPRLRLLTLIGIPFPRLQKTAFVCHSPRRTSPSWYSSFWVHFTRGDGHLPLRVRAE
jgi:hypothetical protein